MSRLSLLLALLALLVCAPLAQARSGGPPSAPGRCATAGDVEEPCTRPFRSAERAFLPFEEGEPEDEEWEEEEAAEEGCEAGEEFEGEEGELEVCGADGETGPLPPEACLLRTARARLLVFDARERVRLVIRYTSFLPASVIVRYRLNGGRELGEARAHFSTRGLFRLSERLRRAEMARVRAARRFTVALEVPAAPRFCRRFGTRRLSIRRTARGQVVWFQADSVFGAVR
jgi:hypothetical protein